MVALQVINDTSGTCAPQNMRDAMRQDLSQSVRNMLEYSTITLHPCGYGIWTRVAYLNMSDPIQQCPSSWRLYSANGVRACGRPTGLTGCQSQNYTVPQGYNKVCGQIIGYQVGSTDAFESSTRSFSIDQAYVDGVSVTYGTPRTHLDVRFWYNRNTRLPSL